MNDAAKTTQENVKNYIHVIDTSGAIRKQLQAYLPQLDILLLCKLSLLKSPVTYSYIDSILQKAMICNSRRRLDLCLARLRQYNYIVNNPIGNKSQYQITLAGKRFVNDFGTKLHITPYSFGIVPDQK